MTDKERFTEGDCHVLARAIHRLTGWPLCAFAYPWSAPSEPDLHAFVRMPDGRLLDVAGAHTERAFRREWSSTGVIREFSLRQFYWDGVQFPGSIKRAREIAQELVARYA